MNNLANEVRLIGTLRNGALSDRRFWAILATAGQYTEYVPILIFAAKEEDSNGFAARVGALADGTTVAVAGRLMLSRELDEQQKPILHPRTGHPLRRTEVVVNAFTTMSDMAATPAPQVSASARAPVARSASAPLPPPLAKPPANPPVPSRPVNMPRPRAATPVAAGDLGTPSVPWA